MQEKWGNPRTVKQVREGCIGTDIKKCALDKDIFVFSVALRWTVRSSRT